MLQRPHSHRLAACIYSLLCLLALALSPETLLADAEKDHAQTPDVSVWKLPKPRFPASNPYSEAKARLGKSLFFDPRLSHSKQTACVNCHNPGLGWADGLERSMLAGAHAMPRHTPSLINVGYLSSYFWDGRASSLEHALDEHLQIIYRSSDELIEEVSEIPGYRKLFDQAFGKPTVTMERISMALATFLRTIVQRNTRFDRWISGDDQAISDQAKRGFALFTGKAGCATCHAPPNFSDGRFHRSHLNSIDPGRFEVTRRPEDRQAFRTPPLREIALTAPYMHAGQKPDLESVIRYYNDSPAGPGARLEQQEMRDLIVFLQSLSGDMPPVTIPRLPLR